MTAPMAVPVLRNTSQLMTPTAGAPATAVVAVVPTSIGQTTAPITAPVAAHRTVGTTALTSRWLDCGNTVDCAAAGVARPAEPIITADATAADASMRDLMNVSD